MRQVEAPEAVLERIKAAGHWRIAIRPLDFKNDRIPKLSECEKLIRETKLSVRGWDFPHCGWDESEWLRGRNHVQSWYSGDRHVDFWRLYQSGQFIYLFSFWEDEPEYRDKLANYIRDEAEGRQLAGYFDTTNIVWTCLEAFAFASRLAAKGLFDQGVVIEIAMHQARGRALSFSEVRRSLSRLHTTGSDEVVHSARLTLDEALAQYRERSAAAAVDILEHFGLDVSLEVIQGIQHELLPPTKSI